MTRDDRTTFLNRVKKALNQGPTAQAPRPDPQNYEITRLVPRDAPDLTDRFAHWAAAEGMHVYRFTDKDTLNYNLIDLLNQNNLLQLLVTDDPTLKQIGLLDALQNQPALTLIPWSQQPDSWLSHAFSADASLAVATFALAETGALVLTTGPCRPRLLQLAPPVHICLVPASRIQPDLLDLLQPDRLTSSFNLVAGPSKTSDIEMKLVTGVHGPTAEHIFILE